MKKNDNESGVTDVRSRLFKVISDFSESQIEKHPHNLEKEEQSDPTVKQEFKFPEKRGDIRKDASVYGIFKTENKVLREFTKNVSVGGVLIDTEALLSYHEDIFMTLLHDNFNLPVRIHGKVARVDPDGVGIKFNQVIPQMSSV